MRHLLRQVIRPFMYLIGYRLEFVQRITSINYEERSVTFEGQWKWAPRTSRRHLGHISPEGRYTSAEDGREYYWGEIHNLDIPDEWKT